MELNGVSSLALSACLQPLSALQRCILASVAQTSRDSKTNKTPH